MRKLKVRKETAVLLRKVKKKILDKPASFNMGTWVTSVPGVECGTIGCIAGWVEMLSSPKLQSRVKEGTHGFVIWGDRAKARLKITKHQADALFFSHFWPEKYRIGLYESKTPKQVARVGANRIEHFIRTGE